MARRPFAGRSTFVENIPTQQRARNRTHNEILIMKTPKRILGILAVGAFGLAALPAMAQSTSTDLAKKELELKQQQLALEKAKLEVKQSEQLDLEKAKIDLEYQKLELEKARRDLMVKETADRIDMQLQGEVLFDTNQAVIKPTAAESLKKVALVLATFPDGKVTVTGYADSRGSDAVNMKLSRDRAEAVKTWLLAKSGVSSERVTAMGMGEEAPAASNETAAGRELNRRVEISVSKL